MLDITPPSPPEDLSVVAISTAVDLTWSPASEHDLSGYRVYYGTSAGNYTSNVWAGKRTEYRLANLTNNVRVYVAVSAVDTSGNESDRSREVFAVPTLLPRAEQRYQGGWPVLTQHDLYTSPALYDIDGDQRLEVAISSRDGKVYLLRYDSGNVPGWPISTGSAAVSSPALGDVDGDGRVEIVAGAGEMMYMWRENGAPVNGWPVDMGGSVLAAPALGDIDGDGFMEVVVGSWNGELYAYNDDATLVDGWPVSLHEPVHSSAALGDIDGDSRIEIVIGSGDGNMYVFRGDGTILSGWPAHVGEEIRSSPAVGDIDGDGEMEIIAADEYGGVHAWHHSGEPVNGWPIDLRERISASPVLGDIDGDKKALEIAIGTRDGSVYVLKSDGTTMAGWPVAVTSTITSSPALGDVNSDGSVDVIVATGTGGRYIGLVYAFGSNGKSISSTMWPIFIEGNIEYSSPALGDVDGDGNVELVVGSARRADGTGGHIHIWDLTGRAREGSIVWGGFGHDSRHTGFADDTLPPSFTIAALQNAALKKHSNIYVIASEKLTIPPELSVEMKDHVQSIPLVQIDDISHIYKADFVVESSGSYIFTVTGADVNGNMGLSSKAISIQVDEQLSDSELPAPARFSLLPNYPNPFNPGTWIPYELPQPANITIDIYSISGQLVRSLNLGRRAAGNYISKDTAAYWDGKDEFAQEAASGVYFYILSADNSLRAARKMILSK
ncbi:FG-GAP-like repeat-containing protein [Candidatus Poribacteria bacterium]